MTLEEIVNNLKSAGQDYGQLFNNNPRMDATKQFGGQLQNNVTQGLEGLVPPSFSSVQDAKSPEYNKKLTDWSLGNGMGMSGMALAINKLRMGDIGFDPRFDNRVLEQDRLNNLTTVKDTPDFVPESIPLSNYPDYPIIVSMSDRQDKAKLLSINDVPMNMDYQGGQGYMLHNLGQGWASNDGPANQIMKMAQMMRDKTGKDPLFLPWTMSPSGGDFANQTGETMLRFAHENMGKRDQNAANKMIKQIIPNWQGMGTEEGITQFRTSPKYMRDSVMNKMDVQFRNRGGLGIGETRLAVADPNQLNTKDGMLKNVAQLFGDQQLIPESGHNAYKRGIPGQGLGSLDRKIMVHQLLPDFVKQRGVNALNPKRDHLRALEVNAYTGTLTDELLKKLGY